MEEEKAVGISTHVFASRLPSLYRSLNKFEPYFTYNLLGNFTSLYGSVNDSPQIEYGVQNVVLIDDPGELLVIPF